MDRMAGSVLLILLIWPTAGWAQQPSTTSAEPTDLAVPSAPRTDGSLPLPSVVPGPKEADILPEAVVSPEPTGWTRPTLEQVKDGSSWPTVWGLASMPVYYAGNRMAPNGLAYDPLFGLDLDFNLGLYHVNTLYIFADTQFWAQKATPGITNPSQGVFDFSKREYDLNIGLACNYWGNWEARVYAYSLNNLNRGDSFNEPAGFRDGVGVENRYYIGDLFFDVARRSFVAVGYLPTRELLGGDGWPFRPSVYARTQLAHDLIRDKLYVSLDADFYCERPVRGRLLWFDAGISYRPFTALRGLEFRVGTENTYDLSVDNWRDLWYVALRFVF